MRQAKLQLRTGDVEMARASCQVGPRAGQRGPIVVVGPRCQTVELCDVPLQWKRLEIEARMLTQEHKPGYDVFTWYQRCISPLALDHAARLVQPAFLSEQNEQQAPQGAHVGARPSDRLPEHALGLGDSPEGHGGLGARQRRGTEPV
jgi:hypothetical protein